MLKSILWKGKPPILQYFFLASHLIRNSCPLQKCPLRILPIPHLVETTPPLPLPASPNPHKTSQNSYLFTPISRHPSLFTSLTLQSPFTLSLWHTPRWFCPLKATKQKRYICSLVNPHFRQFTPYLCLPSRIILSHTKNLTGVPKRPVRV